MKMIQDWLGHSDMGTSIYSHIDSESKKASASVIGNALGGAENEIRGMPLAVVRCILSWSVYFM